MMLDDTASHGGKNEGYVLFSLAPVPGGGLYVVEDNTNTLDLLH